MSREKGVAPFSANFEAQKAAPIDARMIVDTKADLLLLATWTANDSGVYVYKGMIVAVHSDATEDNNGVYRLLDTDYTQESSWEKLGSGSGDPFEVDGGFANSVYLVPQLVDGGVA